MGIVLPLSSAAVKALGIEYTRWMSWTLRINDPAVRAATTELQRAKLQAVADCCRELWDAHAISSFVHEEHVHSVCKIIARMQRRQMARIRQIWEDDVSIDFVMLDGT